MGSPIADAGALDLGLALLRISLGLMIAAHGANKVFGPGGLGGTAGWFEALGLRPGRVFAVVAAASELLVGALLVLGLANAAACAGLVGLMVVAALTDHRGKGFFVFKGGWEYVGVVAVAAVALALAGPGEWSLDAVLGTSLSGFWAGAIAAVGAVLGLLLVAVRPRPGGATA